LTTEEFNHGDTDETERIFDRIYRIHKIDEGIRIAGTMNAWIIVFILSILSTIRFFSVPSVSPWLSAF